jgi:sigma-B regulation protein RsbQ
MHRRHHVHISGRTEAGAETLVFVHGFGSDQGSWAGMVPAFEDRYRVLVFDNAGAGSTDPADFPQSRYLRLDGYVQDLLGLCTACGLGEGLTFVGHSAGAMVAALASIARPGLARRLVMIGASPRYQDDPASGYVGGFSHEALQATYRAVMQHYPAWVEQFAPQAIGNPARPDLAQAFARSLARIPAQRVLTDLCAILQSDHRADLARIAVPTLLLQSQNDLFVPPEVADFLHRHIRGSRLVQLDTLGHFPQLSHPHLLAAAIDEFFDTNA